MAQRRFAGRRALVTGGSSGIGLATAKALVRAGAHVALLARTEAALREAATELRQAAGTAERRITWAAADVADSRSAAAAVEACVEALGGLDLLVNNAGAALARRFEDTPPDAFRQLMEVNYLGVVHVTRAALPHLGRGAQIANVSSLAGAVAIYGYAAYAPSKFAVTAFSEVLRQELRARGIHVSLLLPPDTDTPQLAAEDVGKPAETRTIAGALPPLAAEFVAEALLAGLARRRAWIVPGWRARLDLVAARHLPALARRVLDRQVARAGRAARERPG
mgnify:CR=1 FL=1